MSFNDFDAATLDMTGVYHVDTVQMYFSYLLFSMFLLLNGIMLSSFIVSRSFMYKNDRDEYEDNEEDDEEEEDDLFYAYKYVNEFEEMIQNEETTLTLTDIEKTNLTNHVIMETTPTGDVIMSYEYDNDVIERSKFLYYANNKTIPYKYLDAVARKYVCLYKCPDIYMYIKDELSKELKRIETEKKQDEERSNETLEHKKDSVFASFKNYKNPIVKKHHILVTKNKYKYMGTIDYYNNTLLPKAEQKESKPISFSEFKLMNMSK